MATTITTIPHSGVPAASTGDDANLREILFGLYDDEEKLLAAVKAANAAHLNIDDVLWGATLVLEGGLHVLPEGVQ